MTKLLEYVPDLGIAVVTIGLFGYAIAIALAAFFSAKESSLGARLKSWFTSHPAQNLGIPCAAVSAYAIVAALLRRSPDTSGPLAFKAFGLEFTGPSGPISLWLACFLAFVIAIRLLRN
jgi:hypothetical protein